MLTKMIVIINDVGMWVTPTLQSVGNIQTWALELSIFQHLNRCVSLLFLIQIQKYLFKSDENINF